jgi:hypothetical protein
VQESRELGVQEVDVLLSCVEQGDAALERWGWRPPMKGMRTRDETNLKLARLHLIVSTMTLCSARCDACSSNGRCRTWRGGSHHHAFLSGFLGFESLVAVGSLGGSVGLGWGLGIGLGRSGLGRSGKGLSGVLRAKVAPAAALALVRREHSSVLTMKARCRQSYSEETTSRRGLRQRS